MPEPMWQLNLQMGYERRLIESVADKLSKSGG
jgi:hypothetical protein